MDAQLEVKLIECLDALAQGEPVEQILARYPQESTRLRPLLAAAAGLPRLRLEPSEAMKMKSRQNFLAQAEMLRRTTPRKAMGFLPRFAVGFLAAAIVAIVLGTGAVTASGSALPGDPLYGLKRTVENVRLNTASSPAVREELQLEFTQRRRDEANGLLDAGRTSEVEFTGVIESIQPNAWIVSGLAIQLDTNTQINGTPQINRVAEVHGITGPQGLRASSISIESAGKLDITPTPEATELPQPTETLEPTETPEPARTSAPNITITPRPTATARPTMTATPRPTATSESVEIEFTGNVSAIAPGTWNIDGTTIIVNSTTEVRGSFNVGQRVKIRAMRFTDGRLVATRIEPADNSNSGGNQNTNGNQNSNENQNGNDNSNTNSNSGDDHGGNGNGGGSNSNSNDNSNSGDGHGGSGSSGGSNSNTNGNSNSGDGGGGDGGNSNSNGSGG